MMRHLRRKSASLQRRLGVEPLEQRKLLSVMASGTNLYVLGTGGPDAVAVGTENPGQPGERIAVTLNGATTSFDSAQVRRVYGLLYGGNDFWTTDPSVAKPLTVLAGTGNDRIVGGSAADLLYGESGNDFLYGGNGNDVFYGGTGNDVLSGGDGNDVLLGQTGNDVHEGGPGRDYMNGGDNDRDCFRALTLYAGRPWDVVIPDRSPSAFHANIMRPDPSDPGPLPPLPPEWAFSGGHLIVDMATTSNVSLSVVNANTLRVFWDATSRDFGPLARVTVYGTSESDTIDLSASGPANATSLGVTLTIYGRGGNDSLTGGVGANTLVGDAGDDTLTVPAGALASVFDGRDGVFNNDVFVGYRPTIDTAYRDQGTGVQVVDQIDDTTGAAFYRATTVQMIEHTFAGVDGLFYDLYLDGVLAPTNPRRVNGPSITIEYVSSFSIEADFRSNIEGLGCTFYVTQIPGGDPFDPNRG